MENFTKGMMKEFANEQLRMIEKGKNRQEFEDKVLDYRRYHKV
jgi:hypothetical protein